LVQDRYLFEHGEIKALLAKGFAEIGPGRTARQILSAARKRRRKRLINSGIAAAACLLLAFASLNMPAVARAISSVPLIGEAYLSFIKGSGLDIAYQAGFVTELGSQDHRYDITLTVLGAYADPTETTVMFTLTSADKNLIRQVWDGTYAPWAESRPENLELWPRLKGAGSGSSTLQLDEAEGVIYGLVSADNHRCFLGLGRSEVLQIAAKPYGEPVWQVRFPVQAVSSRHIDTVQVNKTFSYGDMEVTLNEIAFSPAQTVLKYTVKGGRGAMCNWSVKTPKGAELMPLGGTFGSHGSGYKGVSRFSPTDERSLVINFLGQSEFVAEHFALPLKVGVAVNTGRGSLSVAGIVRNGDTRVTLTWTGETKVAKMDAALRDPVEERELRLEGFSVEEDQIELVFPGAAGDQWVLQIGGFVLEDREQVEIILP